MSVAAFVPEDLLGRVPELPRPLAEFRGGIRLLRLPDPWPRAFLAGAVAPNAAISPLDQVESLPKGQAIVAGWIGSEPPAEGSAAIADYAPQRVRVRVEAPREAFLVLNDLASAGWSATVSGSPAPIRTANTMVRAVRVPAGRSEVEFRYAVPGLRAGLLCFAVSLALMLAALRSRAAVAVASTLPRGRPAPGGSEKIAACRGDPRSWSSPSASSPPPRVAGTATRRPRARRRASPGRCRRRGRRSGSRGPANQLRVPLFRVSPHRFMNDSGRPAEFFRHAASALLCDAPRHRRRRAPWPTRKSLAGTRCTRASD